MKKVFWILLLALLSINSVYSFNLTDSSGNEKIYFSLNNPTVLVKTTENLTNFTLTYTLSQEIIKEISFTPCGINYCAEVSLLNLIIEQNESLPGFATYIINVNNQTKEVYLDSKIPEVVFLNSSINNSLKILTLNFNYSDNSALVAKAELFEEVNSQNILLKEISNLSSYNYPVSSIGNKIFIIKVTDLAGNTKEVRQVFAVEDIFNPQILNYMLIKKDDKLNFNFKITDEHIQKYEISQNNITLSEILSSSSIEKTIVLPFSSGNILFKVYDQNSNTESKIINLDSSITYKQDSKYSNKKVFEITSNANECILVKFDSKDINQKFEKSGSKFSISVYADIVKNYKIEFYCDLNNYREYFNTDFYYDNIAPTEVLVNITKTNDGNLELIWTGGMDNQSEVIFNLFRDSNKIYTGKKSNYLDKEVEYPNNYEYYIEAVDDAKNYIKSEKVEEVPKKIKVNLESNLKKDQMVNTSNFEINIKTDINSSINLFIKNDKNILYEKKIENSNSSIFNINVMFEKGINEIQLLIIDEFGNSLKQTYFITYEIPVISESIIEEEIISEKNSSRYKVTINENISNILMPDTAQKLAQNVVSEISSVFMSEEDKIVEEPFLSYTKISVFILFIIFAVLIWHYLFNEDKLKQKVKDLKYIQESKHFDFFRKKDSSLGSSLEKIKEERHNKQVMKIIEEQKKEKASTKIMTDYEKQKYQDISKRDRISDRIIGTDNRKINEEKPKKEVVFIDEEELMKKHEKKDVETKSSFFDWFKKEEQKNDPLLNYINKEKTKKSWNSKLDFLFKEEKPQIENSKTQLENNENLNLEKKSLVQNNTKLQENTKPKEQNTKQESVVQEKQKKTENTNEIDKKYMLDDYLGKVTSKRRSYFTEREVNKDIFERNK